MLAYLVDKDYGKVVEPLCVRIVVSKSVNYYNTRKTTMEALKNGIQQRIEIGYHRKDVAA